VGWVDHEDAVEAVGHARGRAMSAMGRMLKAGKPDLTTFLDYYGWRDCALSRPGDPDSREVDAAFLLFLDHHPVRIHLEDNTC